MKQGRTTIEPATDPRFPPTVHVGSNDRAVRVSFGAIQIFLSNQSDIEFHVEVLAPPG